MLLLYLQQDVKTINRNLPRDESLAPEKVCTVLFGRGRLKITMKRHTACCVRQYCTSNSCPCAAKFEIAGCRSHASGLGKKIFANIKWKTFFVIEKNTIRNQIFVKLFPLCFHLSAFETTFIKTSDPALLKLLTPPYADKKNSCTAQRLYTNDALTAILFQPITARLFPIATPFPTLSILTILLDKQLMKSFKNINILIKVKLLCWKKFMFQKSFCLKKDCHLKEKKFYWEERSFFVEKNVFWKKNFFLEKNLFLWKKIFFLKKLLFKKKKIFFISGA